MSAAQVPPSGADRAAPAMEALVDRLRALRNPDGGWGATADRPSNTEATSLAVLACAGDEQLRPPGLAWLRDHQRSDGSWPWMAGLDAPSWASSQAVLALADADADDPAVARGVDWLVGQEGRGFDWRYRLSVFLTGRNTVELDGTLIGWPWASGTFSWIEPTAFAVLALRKARPGRRFGRIAHRIGEATRMIIDRECPSGGWNYGNKRILGVDEVPYPDTTALALLALQGRIEPAVRRRNFEVLDRLVESTGSGLALALGSLARVAWGLEVGDLLERAEKRFLDTGYLDDTHVIALAVLAARRPDLLRLADA